MLRDVEANTQTRKQFNMDLRLSEKSDLPALKTMFRLIVDDMDARNIRIWDDVYPVEFLQEDIECGRLYVLTGDNGIAAAFALCEPDGNDQVTWLDENAKALYLYRLGVNVDFQCQGVGKAAVDCAKRLAREKGAAFLRLFVVDVNEPAINLYLKNGFRQAEGLRVDDIGGDILYEKGFEAALADELPRA